MVQRDEKRSAEKLNYLSLYGKFFEVHARQRNALDWWNKYEFWIWDTVTRHRKRKENTPELPPPALNIAKDMREKLQTFSEDALKASSGILVGDELHKAYTALLEEFTLEKQQVKDFEAWSVSFNEWRQYITSLREQESSRPMSPEKTRRLHEQDSIDSIESPEKNKKAKKDYDDDDVRVVANPAVPSFAVSRSAHDRKQLHGCTKACCKAYWERVSNGDPVKKREIMNLSSRHRAQTVDYFEDPPDYWVLGMPDTQREEEINARAKELRVEREMRRRAETGFP